MKKDGTKTDKIQSMASKRGIAVFLAASTTERAREARGIDHIPDAVGKLGEETAGVRRHGIKDGAVVAEPGAAEALERLEAWLDEARTAIGHFFPDEAEPRMQVGRRPARDTVE